MGFDFSMHHIFDNLEIFETHNNSKYFSILLN